MMRVAHSDNNSELFTNISSYPPLTTDVLTGDAVCVCTGRK